MIVVVICWLIVGAAFVTYRMGRSASVRRFHWDAVLAMLTVMGVLMAGPIGPILYAIDGMRVERRRALQRQATKTPHR